MLEVKNNITLEAIGTFWTIDFYNEIHKDKFQILKENLISLITEFENKFSRFKESSLIFSLKNKTGGFEVDKEFIEILDIYFEFNKLTHGKFSPLVGSLLEDLGYDKEYSFKTKAFDPNKKNIPLEEVIEVSGNTVLITQKSTLDFGGVGKGYLIDKVCSFLRQNNITDFCIDGGGDIYFSFTQSENLIIGLENPNAVDEIIGTVNLSSNKSICSSSGNRRKWDNHHHIVDPDLKESSNKILACWVIADSATIADTVATCLFLVEPEHLLNKYNFDYLILNNDLTFHYSKGFKAKIFN